MARGPEPELRRTLVLVGMMGAGKSSIGRRLGARLGVRFVDGDSEIEAAAGCSISDIFEFHGEEAFRDGERRVIARLLEAPPHVLATGGGAFVDPDTRALIGRKAMSIWLRADIEVLVRRLKRRSRRPLLKDDDPRDTITRLMDERYPIYAEADLTVDSIEAPHETLVEGIIRLLVERPESGLTGAALSGAPRTTAGEAAGRAP